MGCCAFISKFIRNYEIEQQIDKERYFAWGDRERKLMLLGTDGSGVQTFIRQLHILYCTSCTDEEKASFMKMASERIYMAMRVMIEAMDRLQISYGDPVVCEQGELICSVDHTAFAAFEEPYLTAVEVLWRDNGIQRCYILHKGSPVIDSAAYLLKHLDRIAAKDYVCTPSDVLRVRDSHLRFHEYFFDIPRYRIRIIDPREMSLEQTKWFSYVEDVNILLFVDLSQYDNLDRMEESKAMLKTITRSIYFRFSPIFLIFNKQDIFQGKILFSDLVDHFPDYDGPKKNFIAAKKNIYEMFEELVLDDEIRRGPYVYGPYPCSATDAQTVKDVFEDINRGISPTCCELSFALSLSMGYDF